MARAIWKGVLRFGSAEVPVKLYSGVQDRSVHFRLLHEKTRRPVKQRMVDPLTGKEVPYDEVRRGYEVDEGLFVLLEEDELKELEPEKSRDIEVTRFLDPELINHQWYDRPYHLGPDGQDVDYFALMNALEKKGLEGVARWTMRNKEYLGALRAEEGHLVLITLRHAEEVIPASALEPPGGRKPESREMKMAQQLIDALAAEFDPTEWRDEYRDRVLELIEAKAEGKTLEFRQPAKRRATGDLAASLEASIAAARERKSA
ncbi:MAG: Ku protein [Gemmatimonadetes bacterium]|nr:Ku protein [Gemmatimonadota bacterium]